MSCAAFSCEWAAPPCKQMPFHRYHKHEQVWVLVSEQLQVETAWLLFLMGWLPSIDLSSHSGFLGALIWDSVLNCHCRVRPLLCPSLKTDPHQQRSGSSFAHLVLELKSLPGQCSLLVSVVNTGTSLVISILVAPKLDLGCKRLEHWSYSFSIQIISNQLTNFVSWSLAVEGPSLLSSTCFSMSQKQKILSSLIRFFKSTRSKSDKKYIKSAHQRSLLLLTSDRGIILINLLFNVS